MKKTPDQKILNKLFVPYTKYFKNRIPKSKLNQLIVNIFDKPHPFSKITEDQSDSYKEIMATTFLKKENYKNIYGPSYFGKTLLSKQRIKHMYSLSETKFKKLTLLDKLKNSRFSKSEQSLYNVIDNSHFIEKEIGLKDISAKKYINLKSTSKKFKFLKNYSLFGSAAYINLMEKNIKWLHNYYKGLDLDRISSYYIDELNSLRKVESELFKTTFRKAGLSSNKISLTKPFYKLELNGIKIKRLKKTKSLGRIRKSNKKQKSVKSLLLKLKKFLHSYVLYFQENRVETSSSEIQNYINLLKEDSMDDNFKKQHSFLRSYTKKLHKYIRPLYFPGHNNLTGLPNHLLVDPSILEYTKIRSLFAPSFDQLDNMEKALKNK